MTVRKAAVPTTHARILLVDDNANGLKARKSVLEELGYRISTAVTGEDALEHFCPTKFDLVVTDYKMPRMDGIELIANIRKTCATFPIILISGFADTLGLNEENTGADAVIQKSSHEVSHLVRTVARLLRKPTKKPPSGEAGAPRAKRKSV
jgi:CheY-like chemotaxis protein